MTRLTLPLPPSLNHAYRNFTKGGRRMRVPTSEAERFKRDAGWLAKAWRQDVRWDIRDPGTKIVMRLWYYWPDRRRMDTHNREKVLLDALEGVLYQDDRWVLVQEQDFTVDREPGYGGYAGAAVGAC
jgi:crossover junction endodeoxyribonuclease RusA